MASLVLLKSMLLTKALQKNRKKNKTSYKIMKRKSSVNKCRICYEDQADIPIFNQYPESNLAEEIQNFSSVFITQTDKYSKYICQDCFDLLNGCILFRDLCQNTDKAFIEASKTIVKHEYDSDSNNDFGNNSEGTDSYNIPSPAFSDSSQQWSCSSCCQDFYDLESYNKHLPCNLSQDNLPLAITDVIASEPRKKKVFLCETCGKTASTKASLLVHMSTHENLFPFKCDACPYQGRTIDLLRVHKRSHLAEKPYKCTQCPKATTTASNLAKHMRHVHSTTRPFKCTYCEKLFSYQHDMKRHIRDIHLRQGTVECDICYKKFNTKKILQGHRFKIHKIKGERSGRLPAYLLCQMEEQTPTYEQL